MNLTNVESHLGVSLIPIKEQKNQNLIEVRDIKISGLPVEILEFELRRRMD